MRQDTNISYLPYGGITELTYGNALSLTHGYDNQYRTSSIIVGSIMNRTFDYDPNGNITSNIDALQPPGNETLEDAGAYTYQQATNKLTQVEGELNVVYGYDANGNITSANNRTFLYDLSNRLILVRDDGVTIAQYAYNALNQRIKKILSTGTRIFHYDLSGHLIAETDETGTTIAEYFYLSQQPLAMIRPGEALYYYHNDHLGTPQVLTDDSQAIVWKAVYGAFGEAEIQVEAVENPFRFPGQYYDQETGLHYNWNRYYDPKTGRYLTPDPIGLRGGINLFPYASSNPLSYTDPNGLVFGVGVIPVFCILNPPLCIAAGIIVGGIYWYYNPPDVRPIAKAVEDVCETIRKDYCYAREQAELAYCYTRPRKFWGGCRVRANTRRDLCLRGKQEPDPWSEDDEEVWINPWR